MKESNSFKKAIAAAIEKLFAGEEKEIILGEPFNGMSVTKDIPVGKKYEPIQAPDYCEKINEKVFLIYTNILG